MARRVAPAPGAPRHFGRRSWAVAAPRTVRGASGGRDRRRWGRGPGRRSRGGGSGPVLSPGTVGRGCWGPVGGAGAVGRGSFGSRGGSWGRGSGPMHSPDTGGGRV